MSHIFQGGWLCCWLSGSRVTISTAVFCHVSSHCWTLCLRRRRTSRHRNPSRYCLHCVFFHLVFWHSFTLPLLDCQCWHLGAIVKSTASLESVGCASSRVEIQWIIFFLIGDTARSSIPWFDVVGWWRGRASGVCETSINYPQMSWFRHPLQPGVITRWDRGSAYPGPGRVGAR